MKISPLGLFCVSLAFYAPLFFTSGKLTMVIMVFGYIVLLRFLTGSWRFGLIHAYLLSSPLFIGKTFPVELVSPSELAIYHRPFGISADIIVTIQDLLVVAMAVVLVWDKLQRRERVKTGSLAPLLLFYPVALGISSFFGSIMPQVSLLHALFGLKPILVYLFLLANRRLYSTQSLAVGIASIVVLETVIGLLQTARSGQLGLPIESLTENAFLDKTPEGNIFRPPGTFYHANFLAHALVMYIPLLLPYALLSLDRAGIPLGAVSVLGFLALFLTLSRSAWLSIATSLVLFFFIAEKVWRFRLRLTPSTKVMFAAALPIGAFVITRIVVSRIANTVYTIDPFGSWETRMLLLKEAWMTITEHPWFGVGLGMDAYYGYLYAALAKNTQSVFFYFPESVHNGFLLLWVQTGFVGFVSYAMLLAAIIHRIIFSIKKVVTIQQKLLLLSLISGTVGWIVNSLFQPIVVDLQQLVFLSMIYTGTSLK